MGHGESLVREAQLFPLFRYSCRPVLSIFILIRGVVNIPPEWSTTKQHGKLTDAARDHAMDIPRQ